MIYQCALEQFTFGSSGCVSKKMNAKMSYIYVILKNSDVSSSKTLSLKSAASGAYLQISGVDARVFPVLVSDTQDGLGMFLRDVRRSARQDRASGAYGVRVPMRVRKRGCVCVSENKCTWFM